MQINTENASKIISASKKQNNIYTAEQIIKSFELAIMAAFNYEEKVKTSIKTGFMAQGTLIFKVKNVQMDLTVLMPEEDKIHTRAWGSFNIQHSFANSTEFDSINLTKLSFNSIVKTLLTLQEKYKDKYNFTAENKNMKQYASSTLKNEPLKMLNDKVRLKLNRDNTYSIDFSNLNQEEIDTLLKKLRE